MMEKFLDIMKIIWSWPTVAIIILILYHTHITKFLERITYSSSKVAIGNISVELGEKDKSQKEIEKITGKTIQGDKVILDFKEFQDCVFKNVTLVYEGKGPIRLQNNQFQENVKWEFAGEAGNTIKFLSQMYKGSDEGGKRLIENTFDRIRQGYR